ncbi:sulfatase-like hydrolase/transferase [Halobacterium salinarum]|uniref:sulfatase-like hydrolase/transferase n=1 Tax=Halobacterium salinarum TaxID=2242 RepID=UPI0025557B71|nr:sulfatase-like hydrolase/transferase [Halobacterium salinarum]MDL0124855.1 sulfatase-like hydrolase/transferase [Halobacterium salinarum]
MVVTSAAGTVLVTVDSLRADARSRVETPTLDALADSGTVFERAYAHGNWTPFSFPSVLGDSHVFAADGAIGVGDTTLAGRLADAGVRTAGVNAANGFLTEHWGYDRGFDTYDAFTDTNSRLGRTLAAHPTVQGWLQVGASPFRRRSDGRERVDATRMLDIEDRAVEFLSAASEPFFLWLHYMDTHTPYVPAPRHLRATTDRRGAMLGMLSAHLRVGLGLTVSSATAGELHTLYDATVRQVDTSIGRVLAALGDRREDTMVVVAGDHGEEFLEHGHLAHYPKLYDELVHVPLLVDHPAGAGGRVSTAVGLSDVPATVLDVMGGSTRGFTGESLAPEIRAGTEPTRGPITSVAVRGASVTQQPIPRHLGAGRPLVSARDGRWTYILDPERDTHELYDRASDPGEQTDVSGTADPPLDALHAATRQRLDAIRTDGDAAAATPDDVERRLSALGYR